LTEGQNGFRKKKLTETAIHFFLESTQESIKKKILIGIVCDLTKACDAVNQDIVLWQIKFIWS
jgi:hypothetical protein